MRIKAQAKREADRRRMREFTDKIGYYASMRDARLLMEGIITPTIESALNDHYSSSLIWLPRKAEGTISSKGAKISIESISL